MLVLDTADVPAHERRNLVADTLLAATSASQWTPEGPTEDLYLTLQSWDLNGLEIVDARASAHTLRRSRPAASDEEPVIAMTCGQEGRGVNTQHDHPVRVGPAQLWMTDLTTPHVHRITDTWTVTAKVPLSDLGIPEAVMRSALHRAGESPLAPLFFQHVSELTRLAEHTTAETAVSLRTATLALARAVIASVSNDEDLGRESAGDVLLLRAKAFIRENLADPDLSAASIAAANHVSVRLLYTTFARANLRLEQWIIEQRLVRAHDALAGVAGRGTTVSDVAFRCGFSSSSHFTRRFKEAFGMSPREWQAVSHERRSEDSPRGTRA